MMWSLTRHQGTQQSKTFMSGHVGQVSPMLQLFRIIEMNEYAAGLQHSHWNNSMDEAVNHRPTKTKQCCLKLATQLWLVACNTT